jgi:hypothetical protein
MRHSSFLHHTTQLHQQLKPANNLYTHHQPLTPNNTADMRGNAPQVKVHFKGSDDDYIIFVESAQAVQKWKNDKSTPLPQVVGAFTVHVSHKYVSTWPGIPPSPTKTNHIIRQGTTGQLGTPADSQLENEFGTSKVEDVLQQILEKGHIVETEVR